MDAEQVTSALGVYHKCLKSLESAEANIQKSLQQLREVVGSSTFELAGQWYQIRERKGKLYFCELDEKPKGRPKKTPEQKARDKAEREARRANENKDELHGPGVHVNGSPSPAADPSETSGEGGDTGRAGGGAVRGDMRLHVVEGGDSSVPTEPGGNLGSEDLEDSGEYEYIDESEEE